jgi:hypothetical protein
MVPLIASLYKGRRSGWETTHRPSPAPPEDIHSFVDGLSTGSGVSFPWALIPPLLFFKPLNFK